MEKRIKKFFWLCCVPACLLYSCYSHIANFDPTAHVYEPITRKKIAVFIDEPMNPDEPLNPIISPIRPSEYQIKSEVIHLVKFKTGGRGGTDDIQIVDNKGYCYFISGRTNYIVPLILKAMKTGRDYDKPNDRIKFEYIHSQIQRMRWAIPEIPPIENTPYVEEQKSWLMYSYKTDPKIPNRIVEECRYAPLVSVIAIKFTIDGQRYEYSVDEQELKRLARHTKHVF